MKITIEFYGSLSAIAQPSWQWVAPEHKAITVADVLAKVLEQFPALSTHLPQVACAIGDQLVRRRDAINDGAHLVLLPPVAGG